MCLEALENRLALAPAPAPLDIQGTAGNDTILVTAVTGSLTDVMVTINGTQSGPFRPQGAIGIQGLAGNDSITVMDAVILPTVISGGPGQDTIRGGGGDDWIQAVDSLQDNIDGGPGRDRANFDSYDVVQGIEIWNPATITADNPVKVVKVLVLNYDPLVPREQNQKLSSVLGWYDPRDQVRSYEDSLERTSGGAIDIQVVEFRDLNEIPAAEDGHRYTADSYIDTYRAHGPWRQGVTDYYRMMAEQNVAPLINSGAVDEVWLAGGPYFGSGGWESAMFGPNAFYINGPTYPDIAVDRAFVVMAAGGGERTPSLHVFGHRFESTMSRAYGGWNLAQPSSNWDKFAANAYQSNGVAGVGSVHYPANGGPGDGLGYEYGNSTAVQSWADDYLNYPNLTFATQPINSTAWSKTPGGDDDLNYQEWFHTHIPRAPGVNADGRQNNWWKYQFDFNFYDANGNVRDRSAALGIAPLLMAGGSSSEFFVRYYDDQGIDAATIEASDLQVALPGGAPLTVSLVSVGPQEAGTLGFARTATYRVNAPGGIWDASKNGSYEVRLLTNAVRDSGGTAFAAALLGNLRVNIPVAGRIDVNALVDAGQATVTATTSDIGAYRQVFDGNTNSLLRTASINPAVVTVEFTTAPTIQSFRSMFAAGNNRWQVESANTLADLNAKTGSYQLVVSPTTKADDGTYQLVQLASPVTAKCFRLTVQRLTGDNFVHIREWELLEAPTPDASAPSALLQTANVTRAGGTSQIFSVTYTDTGFVDESTIGSGDVLISGPNGFAQSAVFFDTNGFTDAVTRTATYYFIPPGGYWNSADNGSYTATWKRGSVTDARGNATIADQLLGVINVNVPLPQTVPPSDLTELNAEDWGATAQQGGTTTVENDATKKVVGAGSIKFTTTGGFDNAFRYPPRGAALWDLSTFATLAFSAFAENSNAGGFQNSSPFIRLGDDQGNYFEYRYYQSDVAANPLNDALGQWKQFAIKLNPDNSQATGWRRAAVGTPSFGDIRYVEIHADTWGYGFSLWLDGVGFLGGRSPAPARPDLIAEFDTGWSPSDDVTKFNNSSPEKRLQFLVGGTVAGASVALYRGGQQIGAATATGTSTQIATSGNLAFADGTQEITARQTLVGQEPSVDSPLLSIVVDTAAPQVVVNQKSLATQPDPTSQTTVIFNVTSDEQVAAITAANVLVGGTAGGTLITDLSATANGYEISISGLTTSGSVIVSLATGVTTDRAGNSSGPSQATDNRVFFAPLFNMRDPVDVNDNGSVEAADVLDVINWLNASSAVSSPPTTIQMARPPYLDVTADGFVAPDDALTVINWINSRPRTLVAEGESLGDDVAASLKATDGVNGSLSSLSLGGLETKHSALNSNRSDAQVFVTTDFYPNNTLRIARRKSAIDDNGLPTSLSSDGSRIVSHASALSPDLVDAALDSLGDWAQAFNGCR